MQPDAPAHATLSPSSAHRWMHCPGSIAAERGIANTGSAYAAEGTCAHHFAAVCLTTGISAAECIGRADPDGFVFTEDMAEPVQTYVDTVRALSDGQMLLVEVPVPIGHITGEQGATGTSDAIILRDDEMIVIDLKFGRGVEVEAENNPQAILYALGALEYCAPLGEEPINVRVMIHQPRLRSEPSEWVVPRAELAGWAERFTAAAAQAAQADAPRVPGDHACRFCRAAGTCDALAAHVEATTLVEFDNLDSARPESFIRAMATTCGADTLGRRMDAIPLIETWCKAVRAEAESRLLAGQPVDGYKLVAGRQGARKWTDEAQVEQVLRSMRLKAEEMFDMTLISPTTAEKRLKDAPRRWARLQPLIQRKDGAPSVAPVSDKRPAITLDVAGEFEALA